ADPAREGATRNKLLLPLRWVFDVRRRAAGTSSPDPYLSPLAAPCFHVHTPVVRPSLIADFSLFARWFRLAGRAARRGADHSGREQGRPRRRPRRRPGRRRVEGQGVGLRGAPNPNPTPTLTPTLTLTNLCRRRVEDQGVGLRGAPQASSRATP